MPRVSEFGRHVEKKSSCARQSTTSHPQITPMAQSRATSTSLRRTFDDLYVLVEWHVCESICDAAGPTDFDRIDLRCLAHAENLARIGRREIATASSA